MTTRETGAARTRTGTGHWRHGVDPAPGSVTRRKFQHVAGAALVLVIGACSTDHPSQGSVALLTYPRDPSGFVQDGVTGRLAVSGQCLVLIRESTGEQLALVWPTPGTTWSPRSQTITTEGVSAAVGDLLTVRGGIAEPPGGTPILGLPAPRCAGRTYWEVVTIEVRNPA